MIQNKKGQVTIFIIVAIVIVIILAFLFSGQIKTLVYGPVPTAYVQECIEDATEEVLPTISLQGGSLEPEHYILFQGTKIEYLCYTNDYYKKCIMQKPFLKQDIEQEIRDYVAPRAQECLQNLKSQLESRGSSVSLGEIETSVSIIPGNVIVSVNTDLTVSKEATSSFERFRVDTSSESYDLIMLSTSIANWEARYGDSDPLTYMLYYPDIKVEKKKQGDGTTIYILTNRLTQEKLQFASRSFVFPEGYIEYTKQNE